MTKTEQEALHHFSTDIAGIPLPDLFTNPFYYTPHPLCVLAAQETQSYLAARQEWNEELCEGKMFGVLVVQAENGEIGFLAAFSGILAGQNCHPFFVPPVYDLLQPQGFFKKEEAQISQINRQIRQWEESDEYRNACQELKRIKDEAQASLDTARQAMKEAKAVRDQRRETAGETATGCPLTEEEEARLIHESQFQKAEYRRLKNAWKHIIQTAEERLAHCKQHIDQLKEERKGRSAALQQQLFEQFSLLNYKGERKNLCEIFSRTVHQIPPAGAGECAAPKLLQYAYLHRLRPVAMAEFWWGKSPKTEIRHHGNYYPACKSKCEPILRHMLQGLPMAHDRLQQQMEAACGQEIATVYEDDRMIIVNKPAGMLSVPGKSDIGSVLTMMQRKCAPDIHLMPVHRLDMATSGLLILAKDLESYKQLQAMFCTRQIKKRYIALLDGIVRPDNGCIDLPLLPDLDDRPRQMVHHQYGKRAVTEYEVLARTATATYIAFYPQTGRTHQLRVHAAHREGLCCPIIGDELYGKRADRLYLHAEELDFTHPFTKERIHVHAVPDELFLSALRAHHFG